MAVERFDPFLPDKTFTKLFKPHPPMTEQPGKSKEQEAAEMRQAIRKEYNLPPAWSNDDDYLQAYADWYHNQQANQETERLSNKYKEADCKCSESYGWTEIKCCNICGKSTEPFWSVKEQTEQQSHISGQGEAISNILNETLAEWRESDLRFQEKINELRECLGELVRVNSGFHRPQEMVDAIVKAKSLLDS